MFTSKQICVLPPNFEEFLDEMGVEYSRLYGDIAASEYRMNVEQQLNVSIVHTSVNAYALHKNRMVIGIGVAQLSGDIGKIVFIHLLGKYNGEAQASTLFKSLFQNLRGRGARHVLMYFVPLCTLSLGKVLIAEGFRAIDRMLMSHGLLESRGNVDTSGVGVCTESDWGAATRILMDAFRSKNEPVLYHDLQTIDSAQNVLRQYRAGGYGKIQQECAIAAVCENEVLGIALGTSVSSDVGFVFQVAVIPEYQNKGIGRKLVTSLLAEFVDLGMHEALLGTTVSDPAYTLYKRLGFRDKRAVQVQVWSC